jgi:hypothetical protein
LEIHTVTREEQERSLGVEYRPLPGWPDYEVGSDGSVWSRKSRHPGGLARRLKPAKHNGYLVVGLCRRGEQRPRYVHRLVLEAFVGPRPAGTECRHLDGDRANNRLENLCWGTKLENAADALRHGTRIRGSASPTAKLTEGVASAIRKLEASGLPPWDIAARFGVSERTVRQIWRRKSWCHVA